MKKSFNIGFILCFLLSLLTAVPLVSHGQIPGIPADNAEGGDPTPVPGGHANGDEGPIPVPVPAIDISMLTNRASLSRYALQHVHAVAITIAAHSSIDSPQRTVLDYNDPIKSFDGISRLLEGLEFQVRILGSNDYVSIRIGCYETRDDAYNDLYSQKGRALFNGYAGGNFVQGKEGGGFYLPDWATQPSFYLGASIRVKVPGLVEARFLRHNPDGYYPNEEPAYIGVQDGYMDFQSDWAGAGDILFTIGNNQNGYQQIAFDLRNSRPVPINSLLIRLGKSLSSQDVVILKNTNAVEVMVYSFMGYGNVPLIELKNDTSVVAIRFRITSNEAERFATRLSVIHEESGRVYNFETIGGEAFLNNAPAGTYHVIPTMPIQAWPTDGSFGGGFKG